MRRVPDMCGPDTAPAHPTTGRKSPEPEPEDPRSRVIRVLTAKGFDHSQVLLLPRLRPMLSSLEIGSFYTAQPDLRDRFPGPSSLFQTYTHLRSICNTRLTATLVFVVDSVALTPSMTSNPIFVVDLVHT